MIGQGGFNASPPPPSGTAPVLPPEDDVQTSMPADFAAMLDRLSAEGYVSLEMTLRDVLRVVEYAPPLLAYQLSGPVAPGFVAELRDAFAKVTGTRWELEERSGAAEPTLLEIEQAQAEADRRAVMESPLVKAAFAAFPEAELLDSEGDELDRWSKRA